MAVRIVDFDPRWRADFARLNIDWLERFFVVEPIDREVLSDPETHILADGGRVLFAVDEHDACVGTVALKLYESVGFRHRPAPRSGTHYVRADVYMVWEP